MKDFCKVETVFKLSAAFARDFSNGEFLPDERWEIPIKKAPGVGESISLHLTNHIQGVRLHVYSMAGPGQFTYKRGELVSSTKEITQHETPAGAPMSIPKIFIPGPGLSALYTMPPRDPDEPLVLASRIPYLLFHIGDTGPEKFVGLLERDTSVPDPLDRSRLDGLVFESEMRDHTPYPLRCFGLKLQPGETDKKLTLVVQQARKAEFILSIPHEQRTDGQK